MSAGYSGTPLPRKLGVKEGMRVALVDAPAGAEELLAGLPPGAAVDRGGPAGADVIVLFTAERARLAAALEPLGAAIFPDRALWIAWPKKAAKVPTDVTEDVVRELALPRGLVDVKVCAIDATWSGLRLVWRTELRAAPGPPPA